MPIGVYERKIYSLICEVCNCAFEVKQVKTKVCKKCQKKITDKKYYEKNKEKIHKQTQEYVEKNKEKIKLMNKKYYEKNRDKFSEYSKNRYQENREVLLKKAERYRRLKGINPDVITKTERVVLELLIELFPKAKIISKDRKTLLNPDTNRYLEIDFFIPEVGLAIEVNGVTHYSPIYGKKRFERQLKNDEIKRNLCKELGLILIEIPLESGKYYTRFPTEINKLRGIVKNAIKKSGITVLEVPRR